MAMPIWGFTLDAPQTIITGAEFGVLEGYTSFGTKKGKISFICFSTALDVSTDT